MHIHSVIPAILLVAGVAANVYADFDELEYLVAREAEKDTEPRTDFGPDALRRRDFIWSLMDRRSNAHGQDLYHRSNVHEPDVHTRSNSHGHDLYSRSNAHGQELHYRNVPTHAHDLQPREEAGKNSTSKGTEHDKKIQSDIKAALKDCDVKSGEAIDHSKAGVKAATEFAKAKGYKLLEVCLSEAEVKDRANGNKYKDTLQTYMVKLDDFDDAPKEDWHAFWTIASTEWAENTKGSTLLLTVKDAPAKDSFFKKVAEPILKKNKVKITRLEGKQNDGKSYIKAYKDAGIKKP